MKNTQFDYGVFRANPSKFSLVLLFKWLKLASSLNWESEDSFYWKKLMFQYNYLKRIYLNQLSFKCFVMDPGIRPFVHIPDLSVGCIQFNRCPCFFEVKKALIVKGNRGDLFPWENRMTFQFCGDSIWNVHKSELIYGLDNNLWFEVIVLIIDLNTDSWCSSTVQVTSKKKITTNFKFFCPNPEYFEGKPRNRKVSVPVPLPQLCKVTIKVSLTRTIIKTNQQLSFRLDIVVLFPCYQIIWSAVNRIGRFRTGFVSVVLTAWL